MSDIFPCLFLLLMPPAPPYLLTVSLETWPCITSSKQLRTSSLKSSNTKKCKSINPADTGQRGDRIA